MPKTLQQEFDNWLIHCYPGLAETHADGSLCQQYADLKDAFYAGCLVAYTNTSSLIPELRAHSAFVVERARRSN